MPLKSTPSRYLPTAQGATSKTFCAPPFEKHLTFPEIYAYHAIHSADHHLFVYADEGVVQSITYKQAYRAQMRVARVVKEAYGASIRPHSDSERPVFGILASAGQPLLLAIGL